MDVERELADCVGAIYEAAAGGIEWQEVGARLCRLMDAQSLVIGGGPNIVMSDSEARAVYTSYYHRLNPYVAQARLDFTKDKASHLGTAMPGEALVPDQTFVRSEYYHDFARRYEYRYMIGGMLGIREATPLALYRGHGHRAFDDREVRLLQILLPHSQRGLELEQRLGVARMSLATLDALPTAVAIVDTDLQLHFLNAAGRALVRTPQAPITAVRSGGGNSNLRLAVRSRRETADVLRLVASAASGGAGGSIRVLGEAGSFALLVSPAPAGLIADDRASRLLQGFALILLQPLRRLTPPPLSVLCDVLGLSVAEAEVAAALFGGRSAEEVARRRGVSLPTIRNQIRAILLKAETDNLRDLERLLADLAAVTHPQAR